MFRRIPNLLMSLCALAAVAQARPSPDDYYGRVIHVDTGDRLEIKCRGQLMHVRLWDVRCPTGARGRQAKQFTRDLAETRGARVKLHGSDGRGSRWAEVIFVGGHTLSEALVRAGLARVNSSGASDARMHAAESEARLSHRGIWADRAEREAATQTVRSRPPFSPRTSVVQ